MKRRDSKDATTHRRDGMFAGGLVLAWHVLLGWGLARLLAVPPAPRPQALQVTWIEPRAPLSITRVPPPDKPPTASPAPRRTNEQRRPRTDPAVAQLSVQPVAEAAATSQPLPSDLAEQARAWVQAQAPVAIAAADPLTRVRTSLPGRAAHRFRERPPRSPAEMVALVGVMFGGGGPGPCDEIKDDVAGRAADGATSAVELALTLDFDRSKCRP